MSNLFRHRRPWAILAIAAVAFLLFKSALRSWMFEPQEEDLEDLVPDVNLDSGFQSIDELYANEPQAHQHSVKWSNADEIPETRIFAHIPGEQCECPPKVPRLTIF